MYEKLPIISPNVKVISFFIRASWKSILCLAVIILTSCGQVLHIFVENDFYLRTKNGFLTVLFITVIFRPINVMHFHKEYDAFLKDMAYIYWDLQQSDDDEIKDLLKESTKQAQAMSKTNLVVGSIVTSIIGLFPLFTPDKVLPLGCFVPYVNVLDSPAYEVVYAWQVLSMTISYIIYMPQSNIAVTFLIYGITLERILQRKLFVALHGKDPVKVKREVAECIRFYQRILGYVAKLNEMQKYVYLVEILFFGTLMCALLFLLNLVTSVPQLSSAALYIIAVFGQIFAAYWHVNELSFQNNKIADTIYESPWYEHDTKVQKWLVLIMLRAQMDNTLYLGDMYPINLSLFRTFLSTSYKFFTVIRQLYRSTN